MNRCVRLVSWIACVWCLMLVVAVGPLMAAEASPTPFQQAIASWMSVVAMVAADGGEAERHEDEDEDDDDEDEDEDEDEDKDKDNDEDDEDDDDDEHAQRGHRRGGERAEWGGRGRRGPGGPPPHPRMDHPQRMRADSLGRAEEIIDRLNRIEQKLDSGHRMGNPWSPRPPETGRGERARPPLAAMPPEAQERMRGMMEEGRRRMAEAQEKMEQARKKFGEMEERIKKLEAEVERLKAAR
jgi:hypothetical protein